VENYRKIMQVPSVFLLVTQLSITLEGARSLPLAPGIYCGRDQDNQDHCTGLTVHLRQPNLHRMY